MAPAGRAVGDAGSDSESGARDDGRVSRLRDVRSIDDLRKMDNDDLPLEMKLLTVAFFCYLLHLTLAPLATVSSAATISPVYEWSARIALGFVGLAVLRSLARIVF